MPATVDRVPTRDRILFAGAELFRRAAELGTDWRTVLQDQTLRDAQDEGREHSPLRPAPGSTELDTSGLSVDEVVERIAELARAARAG